MSPHPKPKRDTKAKARAKTRTRTRTKAQTKTKIKKRPIPAGRASAETGRRQARSEAPARVSRPATLTSEFLSGGHPWSRRLSRGQVLRIIDTSGSACVSALFYNARDPIERYNMADTLKAQYTAFLTAGRVLFSDMGRVLVSIIADSCGWHDTISGCSTATSNHVRFGPGRYQDLRNAFHRNARDNFLVALSKMGLGKRDIVSNVNFFVRVSADAAGRIVWAPGNSRPGAYVDLRFEMDTLVLLSNTPHPLDPSTTYAPPPVELRLRHAAPEERRGQGDSCRLSRPENGRGFALTEAYLREIAAWDLGGSLPAVKAAS
jgi:uncharacterized protein